MKILPRARAKKKTERHKGFSFRTFLNIFIATVVRQEMNFTICLTVPTKMSRETVLSMLINVIHIIPTCPNSVAS